ncbi:MAG: transporter substrate-binding domain-containing protein [Peptococcaceae bacterium]|nr:transporter substrate-binding domain-containing protein [Peptococcaceae bacterium]
MVIVLGTALIIAGCSSQEGQEQQTQETAGSGEGEAKETFSFACSGAYYPFSYYDEQTNELVGFDVEIGKALAEAMGMEPKPVTAPWQSLISGLQADKYDAIIGSMTITEERKQNVDFTDPYYVSGPKLFVRNDSNISSVDDLTKDTKIGVLMQSVYEKLAKQYSDNLKFYDSDVTALHDLDLGRVDAVITDQNVGMASAKKGGWDIKAVGDLLMTENIGIAVKKGNEDLVAKINQALKTSRLTVLTRRFP